MIFHYAGSAFRLAHKPELHELAFAEQLNDLSRLAIRHPPVLPADVDIVV